MNTGKRYRVYLPDAENKLRERCTKAAAGLYGNPLPETVSRRLATELEAITDNHYSSDYLIAAELADCSRSAGYPVMSRGMAGSSIVAFLCRFTSVNPLPAHYYCPDCHYFKTAGDEKYYRISGFDLPQKDCPICGTAMRSDGHNIRPEIYLGKNLNKEPDIILNFAPEIRPTIIQHIKAFYSNEQVFRAGTCCINSEGMIINGVHPGGVYIVPGGENIEAITSLRPDDAEDEFQMDITTRDYHELYPAFQRYDLLVLPVLGMVHALEKETGFAENRVPLHENVMDVFLNDSCIDLIPLVTDMEKRLIRKLGVRQFSDLARISGLLHGTDTWRNNGENLIKNDLKLQDAICSRDDIMQELLLQGKDREVAYDIMNHAKHVEYLFPKSHIVEYTILEWKFAWYLTHYPEEFHRVCERWLM